MFSVIYLTGAPATGKSTLSRNLKSRCSNLRVFAYSEELRLLLTSRMGGLVVNEEEIRRKSGILVTPEDIADLDAKLVDFVRKNRIEAPVVIDSHPVTKEGYGFRVTGFTLDNLRALDPDVIVCLYAPFEAIQSRVRSRPMGRPTVTQFEAEMHTFLQAAVAAEYGVLLGKPVYVIDSSVDETELVQVIAKLARLQ